jgi:uncharacterized protein YbjT (DUF2867 family)
MRKIGKQTGCSSHAKWYNYLSCMQRTLLIAGATGSVGTAVTELAAADGRFGRVITWGRRPVPGTNARVEHWGPLEGDLIKGLRPVPVDAVICCLGTTIRQVGGDKAAFIHVDQELVLALGQWASSRGARMCVVTAMAADPKSRIFYNRVKGTVEQELQQMAFPALHLFRPSILDGPRKQNRTGEKIALVVMKALRPLLPTDYRPMPHDTLAKALINAALKSDTGTHVHTYRSILELAKGA